MILYIAFSSQDNKIDWMKQNDLSSMKKVRFSVRNQVLLVDNKAMEKEMHCTPMTNVGCFIRNYYFSLFFCQYANKFKILFHYIPSLST